MILIFEEKHIYLWWGEAKTIMPVFVDIFVINARVLVYIYLDHLF